MFSKFHLSKENKNQEDYFFLVLFIIALLYNLSFVLINMSQPVEDFRQSQTAVTVQSVLRDGITFPYQTPIFGFPWSIPMEFPIYQYVVAAFCFLFKLPVDLAGRLVSAVFFYIALIPSYKLFNKINLHTNYALLFITILLVHPLYVYSSTAFLIETSTLFFSLMFLLYFVNYFDSKKNKFIIYCLLFGILASISKITTFVPFLLLAGIYFIYFFYQHKIYLNIKDVIKYCIIATALAFIPILIAKIWVDYSDIIKETNPLSVFITSKNLSKWNFGTLEQKLDWNIWNIILIHSFWKPYFLTVALIKKFLIGVIIGGLLLYFKNKSLALWYFILFFLYFSAPLIFTNLHRVHFYYPIANTIFAIAAITIFLSSICTLTNYIRYAGYLTILLYVVYNFWIYSYPVYSAKTNKYNHEYVTKIIQNDTEINEIFLIIQNDWSSEIAYALNRKSIIIDKSRLGKKYSQTDLLEVIKKSNPENINYLLVADKMLTEKEKESIISIIKQKFEIGQSPAFQDTENGFTIYALKYK